MKNNNSFNLRQIKSKANEQTQSWKWTLDRMSSKLRYAQEINKFYKML